MTRTCGAEESCRWALKTGAGPRTRTLVALTRPSLLAIGFHVHATGDVQGRSEHKALAISGTFGCRSPPIALRRSRGRTLLVLQAAEKPQNEQKWVGTNENL
jgi:hypothetical protein